MRCPMASDDMGNMRECRPDCAWRTEDAFGHEACAVSVIAAGAGIIIDDVNDGKSGVAIRWDGEA